MVPAMAANEMTETDTGLTETELWLMHWFNQYAAVAPMQNYDKKDVPIMVSFLVPLLAAAIDDAFTKRQSAGNPDPGELEHRDQPAGQEGQH